MDYSEEVKKVAITTIVLMKKGNWGFANAFSIAFRESPIDPELYHTARIGVKSFIRSWHQKKETPEQLVLNTHHRSTPTSELC